ncbi:MAG: histidine kinase N-terminal 7TM domain-containing protein [Bacteroidota bacterium]
MSWQPSVFGHFFLFTTVLSAYIAYSASRRSFPGDRYLIFSLLSCMVWTLTSALEWYSVWPYQKALWSQISYIGIVNVSPAWLCYSLAYCGYSQYLTKKNLIMLWTIPAVTLILALTNDYHGLNWPTYYMVTDPRGDHMFYGHGPSFWLFTLYCYIVSVVYSTLMLKKSSTMFQAYQSQSVVLFVAVSLPWLGNILYNARVVSIIDLTPAAFTFTGALLMWNMRQYRLFDIAPIAREALFTQYRQIAVILDSHNRIIDMNPFALNYFRLGKIPVSAPAAEAFSFWPQLRAFLRADNIAELELMYEHGETTEWFLVSRTPVVGSHPSTTGTLLICRDITAKKQTEQQQELLISELQEALASVKTLGGLLPICASCKKIRDDEGYWSQVEQYIAKHTDAKFTHGICPDCGTKALDDYYRSKLRTS